MVTEQGYNVPDLRDAISIMRKVAVFETELDYFSVLLWAAHTGMRNILPTDVCLYLAFEGRKSSGKTTMTKVAVNLAHDGRMIAETTSAALKRTCNGYITMGIDELDELGKKNPHIISMLRTGNSWNSKSQVCVPSGRDFEVIELDSGGPKVFNYYGEIDDALSSRCITVKVFEKKNARLAINSLFLKSMLTQVKGWLESSVKAHIEGCTPEKIQEVMQSDEFVRRVETVKPQLARGYQQAAILLMVSDIMAWGLDDKIKEIVESQDIGDPFETEKEIIANWYSQEREKNKEQILIDPDFTIEIGSEELRAFVNFSLRDRKLPEIGKDRFKKLKQELGIRDNKDSHKGGKRILRFDRSVYRNLFPEARS